MTDKNNIARFPDLKAIEREASEWIAIGERRDLTPDEAEAFESWKAQSPQHRQMLDELNAVWSDLDLLDDLHQFPLPPEAEETGERKIMPDNDVAPAPARRFALPRAGLFAALAASFALVVAGAVYITASSPWSQNSHATYQTALGEQKTVVLADGSALMLNTQSMAEVDYTRNSRTVRLIRGEAHFDVAHNPARPFSVYAGDNIVRAVGTAFSVRVERGNEVQVIVDEGRVALLSDPAEAAAQSPAPSAARSEVDIAEVDIGGAAMVRGAKIEQMTKLSNEELLRKLAWRNGRISFAGEPLSEALEEIGRYTDISIDVTDAEVENIPIGGAFRIGEVDEFLSALETSFGVTVTRVSDKYVRLSRAS